MSLEAAIEKNTATLEKHAALLEQLLSKTGATAAPAASVKAEAAAPAAEDKPKTTKPKAEKPAAETKSETKAEAAEITAAAMTDKIRPWLGEFAKDHVETVARRGKLAERLEKLDAPKNEKGVRTVSGLEGDTAKLGKLNEWFDKIKVHDFGFGPGRVVADPEEGGDEGGDDDL